MDILINIGAFLGFLAFLQVGSLTSNLKGVSAKKQAELLVIFSTYF